jgi:hypothetical protein
VVIGREREGRRREEEDGGWMKIYRDLGVPKGKGP